MISSVDELELLKRRIDCLERGNRRSRRFGLFAFLGIGLLFVMGQTSTGVVPEVIEARRFVVKDGRGKNLAALGTDSDGAPLLVLTNLDGGLGATFGVTAARRPTLTLYDRAGNSRAIMSVDSEGSPSFSLNDRAGTPRVGLAVATQGSGGLVLYGDKNTARASLGLGTSWSPYLVFMDDGGNIRTALGHADALPPALAKTFHVADYSMMVLNEKGGMVWSAPQKEQPQATNSSKSVAKSKSKPSTTRR
jgi:hypothetical protein